MDGQTDQRTRPEKQSTQNTAKQNYAALVASYDTRSGNEVGLFYNTPRAHTGRIDVQKRAKQIQCVIQKASSQIIKYTKNLSQK